MTHGSAPPGVAWTLLPWLSVAALLGLAAVCGALIRQRLRLQEALSRLQRRWQFWLAASEDRALLELDATGNLSDWSAGARRLHGLEAGEILGQPYALLFPPDERAARVPQDALESAAREGRRPLGGWRVRRDGSPAYIETLIEAQRAEDGTLTGFLLSERDLTERVAQQRSLEQARESLARTQRLAALGRLSDGIAHEFNNVVQVINTCVEALQRQELGSARAGEFLQMIRRNAAQAAALSRHLRGLAGRAAPCRAPTDVNAVVSDVVALLRQTLGEDIAVDLQVGQGLAPALTDRSDLQAALVNLAASARDAMGAGGTGGTLSVSTADVLGPPAGSAGSEQGSLRHYVMISVSRIGAAALDPGLEMVRSYAERSGGRLELGNERDGEAIAKLYLPCQAA